MTLRDRVRSQTLGPDDGAPDWWRRSASLRRIPVIVAIVIAVVILRAGQSSPPPTLATSCRTASFALSSYTTAPHHTLRWSATGPAGMRYVLAVGVAAYTPAPDGGLDVEREDGVGIHDVRSTGPQTMPQGCKADGSFGIVAPAGNYAVRLFRIAGTGAGTTVTAVADKQLVVTAG